MLSALLSSTLLMTVTFGMKKRSQLHGRPPVFMGRSSVSPSMHSYQLERVRQLDWWSQQIVQHPIQPVVAASSLSPHRSPQPLRSVDQPVSTHQDLPSPLFPIPPHPTIPQYSPTGSGSSFSRGNSQKKTHSPTRGNGQSGARRISPPTSYHSEISQRKRSDPVI